MRLSDYLLDTKLLLRDTNSLFTTDASLRRYINQARYQVAKHTACLRVLVKGQSEFGVAAQAGIMIPGAAIPNSLPNNVDNGYNVASAPATTSNNFATIPGVELYPYKYANDFIQDAENGIKGIVDIISISVSWGGCRPTLNWMPFEDLQAYMRSSNLGMNSYPIYWSTYGSGENAKVFLFPVPSQASEMEWDCYCVPKPLYSDDDIDAIPEPFQQAVKYHAAYLALLAGQRHGSAEIMKDLFMDDLEASQVASNRGKNTDYYWSY